MVGSMIGLIPPLEDAPKPASGGGFGGFDAWGWGWAAGAAARGPGAGDGAALPGFGELAAAAMMAEEAPGFPLAAVGAATLSGAIAPRVVATAGAPPPCGPRGCPPPSRIAGFHGGARAAAPFEPGPSCGFRLNQSLPLGDPFGEEEAVCSRTAVPDALPGLRPGGAMAASSRSPDNGDVGLGGLDPRRAAVPIKEPPRRSIAPFAGIAAFRIHAI
jgi:hypothetical protein